MNSLKMSEHKSQPLVDEISHYRFGSNLARRGVKIS